MSYCINPHCPKPFDLANAHHRICRNCGSELILKNRYRVVKQLGQGGFGNTFEVDDSGETKVLKVLTENNTKAVELFQQEAKVLTQLQSAGIPKVDQDGYFTFFPRNSQVPLHCLVMEKISGVDLEQWMESRDYQPITQTQAVDWLKQLVEILALVHSYQYFHRDIKPQNIMLRPTGQLVLIDFGAVRQITTTILEGNSHTRIISQGYSPPEQQNGYSVQQSDFFALGRTFIFLLTGKQPQDQAIYDPVNNELHWRKYAVNLSVLLADLIDDLTAPTANQRPENTQVIFHRLKAIEKSLNKPHTSINTTKIQSSHSSLPTISISPSKSNNATGQLTKNWVKYWQWIIGLGVGCFAIATFFQPYNQNTVIPQENPPGFSPGSSNTSPVNPITQPTPNTQPKITQSPVNVTASQEIEIQKRGAALKAEQQRQAAIAAQKKRVNMKTLAEVAKSCQKDVVSPRYYQQMLFNSGSFTSSANKFIEPCIRTRYHYSLVLEQFPGISSGGEIIPGYPGSVVVGLLVFGGGDYPGLQLDCLISEDASSDVCYWTRDTIAEGLKLRSRSPEGHYLIYVCPSCVVAHDEVSGSRTVILRAFMKWFLTLDKPERRQVMSLVGDENNARNMRIRLSQQSSAAIEEYREARARVEQQERERRRQELLGL